MDTSKIAAARELFSENEYWKKMFEDAPSDECKMRIALNFYYSTFYDEAKDDQEFFDTLQAVEDQMDIDYWKYLLKYQGNNPGVVKIKQKIAELSQK